MLIDVLGFWINPDHIVRLAKDANGNVSIVLTNDNLLTTSRSLDDVAGIIIRSCLKRNQ